MSKEKTETKAEAPAAPAVSANPALVEFPRDTWGFTSELRKIGLLAASDVRGNKEKQDLYLATLRVLAQHSLARFNRDAADLLAQIAEIEERDASLTRRQFGRGDNTDAE
ncbi:hypothetical protein [Bradyrhizobium sp. LTSP885]|uniref:hypothetical protein n=1 Tax=Bradyrhizobium sp. LTSP885 TaxID=1619232 RepID=UPI000AA761FC|nr:hypothetical protein [Bradyrhizobium sp. LTSP885]